MTSTREGASTVAQGRPTLAEVAARAGVAVSTASLAFSGKGPVAAGTRLAVRRAAESLGYSGPDPRAATLRTGLSRVVGVVLTGPVHGAFRDPVHLIEVDAIAERLSMAGHGLLLLPGAENEALLAATAMDAAILLGCAPDALRTAEALHARGLPMIAIDGVALNAAPQVTVSANLGVDSRAASAELAHRVAAAGHQRVMVVALPLIGVGSIGRLSNAVVARACQGPPTIATERINGVRGVLPSAAVWMAGDSTIAEGLRAGHAVLDRSDPPSAIIAQSDLLAVGVIRAAEERGLRVPGDLSVVGFDGVEVDGFPVGRLSTVRQPLHELGLAAADAALAAGRGEPPEERSFTVVQMVGQTLGAPD